MPFLGRICIFGCVPTKWSERKKKMLKSKFNLRILITRPNPDNGSWIRAEEGKKETATTKIVRRDFERTGKITFFPEKWRQRLACLATVAVIGRCPYWIIYFILCGHHSRNLTYPQSVRFSGGTEREGEIARQRCECCFEILSRFNFRIITFFFLMARPSFFQL